MTYTIRACAGISEVGQTAWDACANPSTVPFDPFLSFAFLHALEESNSAVARTGWAPYHLALEDENGNIKGVVPLYLKSHSQGEYVFDYSWADAFERAGGRYYPKLQCSRTRTHLATAPRPSATAPEGLRRLRLAQEA